MLGHMLERIQAWWNPPPIFPDADGDEETYHNRFIETEEVLGEGEFGIVKVVQPLPATTTTTTSRDEEEEDEDEHDTTSAATVKQDKSSSTEPQIRYAVKILPKGMTMRDNVLYNPINPSALQTEVNILKKLNGKRHSSPQLYGVYESPKSIYLITELCHGGNLMDYRSNIVKQQSGKGNECGEVPARVLARVAYQLLDAVDHCAKNGVIHRDIKPDNIMFLHKLDTAETSSRDKINIVEDLRLIDYGSGALLNNTNHDDDDNNSTEEDEKRTTYAGSPFYNSPEMFRKSYTYKTDVWSAGITLYVFVAGFPCSDIMQGVFDTFHLSPKKMKSEGKDRNLRLLPNVPEHFSGSFYDMLERLLVYGPKKRATAGDMLDCEFVMQKEGK